MCIYILDLKLANQTECNIEQKIHIHDKTVVAKLNLNYAVTKVLSNYIFRNFIEPIN